MNPGGHSNDHFEHDLEQVADAYREIHPDEPPGLLDQAVLGKARLAVESKSVRPWNFGWIHAVTTTAVLVLAITVVRRQPEKAMVPQALPTLDELSTRESSDYRVSGEGRDQLKKLEEEPADVIAKQAEFKDKQEQESFAAPAGRQDAPADQDRARLRQTAKPDSEPLQEPEVAVPPEPGAESTSADIRDAIESPGEREVTGQEVRRAVVSFEEADEITGTKAEGSTQVAADAAVEGTPSPMAPIIVTGNSRLATGEEVWEETREEAQAPVRTEAEPSLSMSSEAPAAIEEVLLMSAEEPEAWLERIRTLKDAGDQEAFEAELQAFRETWPDYPVPEDLLPEAVADEP